MNESPRNALELALGNAMRIELDASLASAERYLQERAFPRHHGRQRLQIVEADALVIANAPLERPEQVGVLNAIAFEEPNLTGVHAHREVHDDLVLRLAEDDADVVGKLDDR